MIDKLEALCQFKSLFYVENWLSASVGVDAPHNDLQLWHDLHEYHKFDPQVVDVTITTLERHLWYLTEECSVFSLFSNRLSDTERQQIARQLARTSRPTDFERDHPTFPVLNRSTKLVSLIGPRSWFMFQWMLTD